MLLNRQLLTLSGMVNQHYKIKVVKGDLHVYYPGDPRPAVFPPGQDVDLIVGSFDGVSAVYIDLHRADVPVASEPPPPKIADLLSGAAANYQRFLDVSDMVDPVCALPGCGKTFKPSTRGHRYCSFAHYFEAHPEEKAAYPNWDPSVNP